MTECPTGILVDIEPDRKPKIRPVHKNSGWALDETFLKPFTPRKFNLDYLKIASIEKEKNVLNYTFDVGLLEDEAMELISDDEFEEEVKKDKDDLTAKERAEICREATKLWNQFKDLSLENEKPKIRINSQELKEECTVVRKNSFKSQLNWSLDSASITAELFNFSPLETSSIDGSVFDPEFNKENCFASPQLELTRIVQSSTTTQNEIKNNTYDLEEEKLDASDQKLPDLQSTFDKSNPETSFLETKEPKILDKTVIKAPSNKINKPGPVKTFVKPKPKVNLIVKKSQSMREPVKNLIQKPQIKKPATATGGTRKIIAQNVKSVNTTPAKRFSAILPAPSFTSTPNTVSNRRQTIGSPLEYVNLKNKGVVSHLVKKSNPTQRSVLSNIPAPNNIVKKNIFTHKESKLVAPAIKRSKNMF